MAWGFGNEATAGGVRRMDQGYNVCLTDREGGKPEEKSLLFEGIEIRFCIFPLSGTHS